MYKVGIVGVTGAVGLEFLKVLKDRRFPIKELRVFASERSKGREILWGDERLRVEVPSYENFKGLDLLFFTAGAKVSLEYVPIAVKAGAIVIDNSSAFRMEKDVPLVVPEVNGESIEYPRGIIANPNCSTIQLVMVLYPLHRVAGLKRVVVSTYQAVSGAGLRAIEELKRETRKVLEGEEPTSEVFPHPIAFEALPHIDIFQEYDYTKEEWKIIKETRKILGLPDLRITATAVRIPVIRGHSESVNVEFERELSVEEAREALRRDLSVEHGLNLWIVSDNLLKGAALNAVQIAESLIKS